MRRLAGCIAAFFLVSMSAAAAGGAAVSLETVEGGSLKGEIVSVEAGKSIKIRTGTGDVKVAVPDIVRLTPQEASAELPGEGAAGMEALFLLRTGERLKGRLIVATAEELAVRTESLGRLTVPLKSVAGVVFGEGMAKRDLLREIAAGELARDRVYTATGDRIDGLIERFENDGIRFASDLGKIPYRFDALSALAFGAFAGAPALPKRSYCTVRLAEGELACDLAGIAADGRLRLAALAGFECELPVGAIRELTVRNGRLVHLSELEPRVETKSYIEGLPFVWQVRRDRNVLGRPLKLGTRTYARGVGVHSYTRLAYPLGGGYARFEALAGLDADAAGRTSKAALRVLVDGEKVFEAVLARGDEPARIALNLAGKKELVLVADFGPDGDDRGDAVNWVDARLVKKK